MNDKKEIMLDKSLTLLEMLKMMDAKIEHIEDITADNRSIMIKLVKQSNNIVTFLKQLELHDVEDEFESGKIEDLSLPEINPIDSNKIEKYSSVEELVDDFVDKSKDLQELEQELKKHKDKITPGQVGEA